MRGSKLARAVVGGALGLASVGCALEQRVTHLEHESEKRTDTDARVKHLEETAALGSALLVKWRKLDVERFAAIERREERFRMELARLEAWQERLNRREAELARAERAGTTPALEPATPRPAPSSAPVPKASPAPRTSPAPASAGTKAAFNPDSMYVQGGANPWSDPFSLTMAQQIADLYATGERPEKSEWLDGEDTWAPGGPAPYKPRDPGSTGKDGDAFLGKMLERTRFLSSTGETLDLASYRGKKNVVLVVLRGFDGSVCIACSGQTLAISQNLDEFAKRNAEVFLIYPGKPETVPIFLDAVRDLGGAGRSLPVDILLDVDLSVVREFKIEGRLAKPSTLIIDEQGVVRFAHVGQSKTDRPTVPQMLAVLDRLTKNERSK